MRQIPEESITDADISSREPIVVVDENGDVVAGYGRDTSFSMPPVEDDESFNLDAYSPEEHS